MRPCTLQPDRSEQGQTVVELAVFGAVLIFVIGLIVRTGLSNSHSQHHNLRALRRALTTSFEYSQGIEGTEAPGNRGNNGNASRNTATVIFIEDRLTADSAKYGPFDRVPLMIQASGTHSRNLFMPIDAGESYNVPRLDVYVNGKHFPFTVARLKGVALTYDHDGNAATPNIDRTLYTRIPNHPKLGYDADCGECFDLDRDGTEDVPADLRATFAWQWKTVSKNAINLETMDNIILDVDDDLYEERVVHLNSSKTSAVVMDFNDGDIDALQDPPPGFDRDIQMFTYVKGSPDTPGQGTYLEIKEGKLYSAEPTRQYISTASKKDHVDVIQRIFRLSNDTGRFCPDSRIGANLPGDGVINPVEACGSCFSPENIELTCMDPANKIIYIRSRVADLHGHKWITDVSRDRAVDFLLP